MHDVLYEHTSRSVYNPVVVEFSRSVFMSFTLYTLSINSSISHHPLGHIWEILQAESCSERGQGRAVMSLHSFIYLFSDRCFTLIQIFRPVLMMCDREIQYKKAFFQFQNWFKVAVLFESFKLLHLPKCFSAKWIPHFHSTVNILRRFHHSCYLCNIWLWSHWILCFCLSVQMRGFCFRVFMLRNIKWWSEGPAGFTVIWLDLACGWWWRMRCRASLM